MWFEEISSERENPHVTAPIAWPLPRCTGERTAAGRGTVRGALRHPFRHPFLRLSLAVAAALLASRALAATTREVSCAPAERSEPAAVAPAPRERALELLRAMTLPEKVAQMVMTSAPTPGRRVELGGVILHGKALGSAERTRRLVAELQRRARVPLLVAVDVEGGGVNRLRFVRTLAALPPPRRLGGEGEWEAEAWGTRAGLDMLALGINCSLGPVLDVSPDGLMSRTGRSLGGEPDHVARLGRAYARGLRSAGVLPIGKHFPGYGTARRNSDIALVIARRTRQDIAREAAAFVAAGDALEGVMLANVGYTSYGSVPAIFSPQLVASAHLSGWLAVTDDLAVPALREAVGGDAAEVIRRAFLAGNDLLLTTAPPGWRGMPDVRKVVLELVRRRPALEQRVDESVLRILRAKERAGLLEDAPGPGVARTEGEGRAPALVSLRRLP